MKMHGSIAMTAGAAMLALGICAKAADEPQGKSLYQSRCGSCHSLEYNGFGPAHKGLFGRKAGSAPGFSYSQALKDSTVVWNEQTLERWLSGPEAFIPGQKMGFSVSDAAERAQIIAYLAAATRR
jgi:cytochrome c